MPRTCTICIHPDRPAIDAALVGGAVLRNIAQQFGTSATALHRHKADHLPAAVATAHEAEQVAKADDLLEQLQALRNKAMALLLKAEAAGDYRTALAGIREARACIETLLEVEGELDRRPQVNITISAEWIEIRSVILLALQAHPEARQAVVTALGRVDTNVAA
jgi:transposase-like protein